MLGETTLTPDESEAVRMWLYEVFHSDPAGPLVDDGWPDETIDSVIASVKKKLKIKGDF